MRGLAYPMRVVTPTSTSWATKGRRTVCTYIEKGQIGPAARYGALIRSACNAPELSDACLIKTSIH